MPANNAFVHVTRDGTILVDGEAVGFVEKVSSDTLPGEVKWRAEVGDVKAGDFAVVYDRTRAGAVRRALDKPDDEVTTS